MNISDLNTKIYGHKDLKQGEYANFIINSIEKDNFDNFKSNNIIDELNKEIKF